MSDSKGHGFARTLRYAVWAVLAVGTGAAGDARADGWRLAGAGFNPVRSMPRATSPSSNRDQGVRWLSLSGTARLADDPGRDEIAIPVAWSARRGVGDVDLLAFELDVQYRRFLASSNHGGSYAGPLLRVTHRRGHERGGSSSASDERLGIGFVLGYRLPVAVTLHWDLSFTHGRFLDVGPRPDARDPVGTAVMTDTIFNDNAVLRLVRRF